MFMLMDFSSLEIVLIKDGLLLFLCTMCCGYCALLSVRLKRLRNMKDGLGASIIELTEAIERTHRGARDARAEMQVAMVDLRNLKDEVRRASGEAQARTIEVERARDRAKLMSEQLERILTALNRQQKREAYRPSKATSPHTKTTASKMSEPA